MGNNNQKNEQNKNNIETNKKKYFNNNNEEDFLSSYYKSNIIKGKLYKQNKIISSNEDIFENELYEFSPVKRRLSTNDNFKSFFERNLKKTKKIDTSYLRKNSFLPIFGETITKFFRRKKEKENEINQSKKMNTIISQRTNISESSSFSLLNPVKINIKTKITFNFKSPIFQEIESHEKKKFNSNSNINGKKVYFLPIYNPPIYLKPQIKKEELPIYISKHIESNYKKKKHNEKIYGLFIKKIKNFKFIGTKKNNKKEGFGLIIWNDNSILKGKFKNNKINNISSFSNSNNTTFQGYYIDNKPLGFGIFNSKKEDLLCEGEWKNDKLNGIGIQLWNHSNFFYGEFNENKKEGIGTVKFEDGTSYYGEFKNDKISGYGIIHYFNGSYYEGEFNDGIIHGYGEFTWINGKKFIGYYEYGEKNGFGIYINNIHNFNVIVGFWHNGKLNGPCIFFRDNKINYFLYRDGLKYKKIQTGLICLKYLNEKYKKYWKLFDMNLHKLHLYIKKIIHRDIEVIDKNK